MEEETPQTTYALKGWWDSPSIVAGGSGGARGPAAGARVARRRSGSSRCQLRWSGAVQMSFPRRGSRCRYRPPGPPLLLLIFPPPSPPPPPPASSPIHPLSSSLSLLLLLLDPPPLLSSPCSELPSVGRRRRGSVLIQRPRSSSGALSSVPQRAKAHPPVSSPIYFTLRDSRTSGAQVHRRGCLCEECRLRRLERQL